MSKAVRVPGEARGANMSVMLSVPPEERIHLLAYIEDGMTLEQALDRLANKAAGDFDRTVGVTEIANPFSPS